MVSTIFMNIFLVIGIVTFVTGIGILIYKFLEVFEKMGSKHYKRDKSYKIYKKRERQAAEWLGRWGA